jgi:hypothetical protein
MSWQWLFNLESWLLSCELDTYNPYGRRRLHLMRRPVSYLTRRLERRGRML